MLIGLRGSQRGGLTVPERLGAEWRSLSEGFPSRHEGGLCDWCGTELRGREVVVLIVLVRRPEPLHFLDAPRA
mgnify:CR=1 FL=1